MFGAIRAFAQFQEVNTIAHKVTCRSDFSSFSDIVYSRTSYRFTENMHRDNSFARYKEDKNGNNIGRLSKGHDYDMASNIFERIPEIFFDEKPSDGKNYIKILGREGSKRVYKYVRREYVNNVENMGFYKVLIPQANGNGSFGEIISQPVIEGPMVGNTETFISIGKFKDKREAEAVVKYISTKFARTLLSILKVTQNGNKPVWKMIPIQDFSSMSDINWSKSIYEIDQQLYQKYDLTDEEIQFIETNVKEMV